MERALEFADSLADFGAQPEVYSCLKQALYRPIIEISSRAEVSPEIIQASAKHFNSGKFGQ